MMDYKEIFEDTLSEICEKAPFSDDEQMFNIVIERTSNMEKKKFKWPKFLTVKRTIFFAIILIAGIILLSYFFLLFPFFHL